ncbi:MAG: thiamine-monophosphate kinase [Verrucomicrobia bacterium]|nr:thiamine-monophosphate kinase [Verrucomicrobiota bacterium]
MILPFDILLAIRFDAMFRGLPSVNDFSEQQLIDYITQWLRQINPVCPEGIGDDCAVHSPDPETKQIITSDALVFGQHFDQTLSAQQAGAKLVNRNLSDIAAMGGIPDRAILNLMVGPDLELDWLKNFFIGLEAAAIRVCLKIVGGDICRLEPRCFSSVLTLIGTAKFPLLRGNAQRGDAIYVTGDLGGSLLGKHATFTPRLAEGQWLAETGYCTALMDLTDGLAKDLPSLLTGEQSARLNLSSIPVSADAHLTANRSGLSALEHAFCDGEDYELLFSIAAKTPVPDFVTLWKRAFPNLRISHIGQIDEPNDQGKIINAADGSALPFIQGFEHFRKS